MDKRRCVSCNRAKAKHLYYASQWKKKSGAVCKSCAKSGDAWRRQRDNYLQKTYNITLEEYERMLESQGGACYICRKVPRKRQLAVDHNHAVAELIGIRMSVRGLLCGTCNEFLGHIRDDAKAGERVAEYLRRRSPLITPLN